jgi:hypothetical protein
MDLQEYVSFCPKAFTINSCADWINWSFFCLNSSKIGPKRCPSVAKKCPPQFNPDRFYIQKPKVLAKSSLNHRPEIAHFQDDFLFNLSSESGKHIEVLKIAVQSRVHTRSTTPEVNVLLAKPRREAWRH